MTMSTVVIEGSILPCGFLARGERVEVQRTAHIDRLIEQGFVNVISETGDPEPAPLPEPVKAPARSASRDTWAEFLAEHTDIVTEDKGRDELVAEYDEWQSVHDVPATDDSE
ncbi:hypothetical protein PBI_ORION_24 [Mycobacterium phage Orion]|uniref:Tail assembly chaperone n=53 Tax=Pegunavirus TaxID=1623295 RepID=Q716Q1_9CAUD|nr:hypothetical protein PBI_PG1_24 [Mycobacterium phage PG1]YP_009016813.1 hypothetical protein VISTA_24 [Mycobacterium phage Vista]YP_009018337.1 hypothetical protein CL95_gp024 [Mycobacterium phage JacAttac]YP_009168204.1 hypothetical protein UNCLEHOWIE_24 [Mycobacterium phage UncleHowie]YP_009208572.1 hypothetical protein AVV54_gp024 [Mycobacterium phage Kikipoo]YP_009211822.1 hypothetical protein AVV57_gp24 [Mycobacterium phage Phipps]YP_655120.1 gp24 [Mycobacterium phage Orion]ACI12745.